MHPRGGAPASLYTSRGHRKYLTPPERARFIAAAKAYPRPEVRTLCLTLAYTGCRISEALALTARAIEFEGGFIAVSSLKKRCRHAVVREILVPPDLLNALESVHGLVERADGERLWALSRTRAWQITKEVMALADVNSGIHATPKGLRHGFAIHALRCGVPLPLVQRWLGHASIATTAIYLQAVGAEEREYAARCWTG